MNPGRQTRLVEIGAAGQKKLDSAIVALRSESEFSREIEERYLVGAGIVVGDESGAAGSGAPTAQLATTPSSPPAELARLHPSARALALGAWQALASVRTVLGTTSATHGGEA